MRERKYESRMVGEPQVIYDVKAMVEHENQPHPPTKFITKASIFISFVCLKQIKSGPYDSTSTSHFGIQPLHFIYTYIILRT